MKYCPNCGTQLNENQEVCLQCGKVITESNNSTSSDTGGFGWGLLGFCIPLVGLILYIVWKEEKPITAKAVGIGAIIGFVLSIFFGIFQISFLENFR